MNCLRSRRLLLTAPRQRFDGHKVHIATCDGCARLVHQLVALERSVHDATLVPVPDALFDRVLLRQCERPRRCYAAIAVFAVICVLLASMAAVIVGMQDFRAPLQAVGPDHPTVGAISEVMEGAPEAEDVSANGAYIEAGLRRLGLSLKPGAAVTYHVGSCRIEGVGECEHIALSTPKVDADVILVPRYPAPERVLVADRRMVALMTPAGSGAYIVVAGSAEAARIVDRLFLRDEPMWSAKWLSGIGRSNLRG